MEKEYDFKDLSNGNKNELQCLDLEALTRKFEKFFENETFIEEDK